VLVKEHVSVSPQMVARFASGLGAESGPGKTLSGACRYSTRRNRATAHQTGGLRHYPPQGIRKTVADILEAGYPGAPIKAQRLAQVADDTAEYAPLTPRQMAKKLKALEKTMYQHTKNLEFEAAARIRDHIRELREQRLVD